MLPPEFMCSPFENLLNVYPLSLNLYPFSLSGLKEDDGMVTWDTSQG